MVRREKGTNLWKDPRTGMYVYRRTDPITGRRSRQSTGTKILELAVRKVAQFEEEREKKRAGLVVLDNWHLELLPLAEEWLRATAADLGEAYGPQKRMRLLRALSLLKLEKARDLDNVARIHDRLMALPATRSTKRRAFQDPLRQFSAWLAANKRYLDRDPLLCWEPIPNPKGQGKKKRRAILPDELARTVLALDRLDAHYRRKAAPVRPLIVALFVAGPRVGALLSRDVQHLDVARSRIDLGLGCPKKRRGAGALDPKTLAEVQALVGDRKEGPLFRAVRGGRPTSQLLLDQFREAFSLGVVDALWPAGEERRLDLAMLTNLALLRGRVPQLTGNPKLIREETRVERAALEERVYRIAALLRPEWERRVEQVDVHGLRKTHRSWAQARGVPPVVIDKQLGHADPGEFEVVRALAGSDTGRKHYLDLSMELFDAGLSAKAVREMLDEALSRLVATSGCSLVP
jgi:hypothetical protein